MCESSKSGAPKERGADVSCSSRRTSVTVVEATGRSTNRGDTNESQKKYARAGLATYDTVHGRGAEFTDEKKVVVGLAELFRG